MHTTLTTNGRGMDAHALLVTDLGARGDGETDDAAAIQAAAEAAVDAGVPLIFPAGVYRCNAPIKLVDPPGPVRWLGQGRARLLSTIQTGAAFRFLGRETASTTLQANAPAGSRRIVAADLGGMAPAHLLALQSNKSWYHDPRSPVGLVQANAGVARGGSADEIVLAADGRAEGPYVGATITIIAGRGAGQARDIVGFDPSTLTVRVARDWSTAPDETSRYVIPQAFKGELHRIAAIEPSSGMVELHAPLWDGYDVADDGFGDALEDVRISCHAPVTVEMRDLQFEWQPTRGMFQMLHVRYGSRCRFENITILKARGPALQLERSYDCMVDDAVIEGSDGKFTGYGVVSQCASFISVRRSRFFGCRRAVDWSSSYDWVDPYPSRGCRVEDCVNFGGGFRQDGRAWGAVASGEELAESTIDNRDMYPNFGFGSHGPADNNEFIDNRAINVHCGILLRGRSERAEGNRFYGRVDFPFKVWFGANHVIKNNHYVHPSAVGDADPDEFYTEWRSFDDNAWNAWTPLFFIEVVGTRAYYPMAKGYLDISDNTVRSARRGFINLALPGATEWEDIRLSNNHVTLRPTREGARVFFLDSNNSGVLRRLTDRGNVIEVRGGDFTRYRPQNPIERESCVIEPVGSPQIDGDSFAGSQAMAPGFFLDRRPAPNFGTEILSTRPLKPTYRGARFRCQAHLSLARTDDAGSAVAALFRGTTCIAARVVHVLGEEIPVPVTFSVLDDPRTDQPVVYSVRVGPEAQTGGRVRVNGDPEGPYLGGAETAELLVEEIC